MRDPLAAQLSETDDGARPVPARGRLGTGLIVNGVRVAGPDLELHGPGDVVGLDERQVVRTEPTPGATAAEPEYLAAIDFDDPALPWRLTPLAPRPSDGLLRPWLVLVVVDTGEPGVAFAPRRADRLPVLTAPGRLLPPLADSPAWAHADVITAGDETVEDVLAGHPERAVSRLVCPTPLVSGRQYLACLVPAFAHGVAAGLGDEPTGDTTGPAWLPGAAEVRLPVYHSWRFTTGPGGDFLSLAAKLRATTPGDGRRRLAYCGADPELDAALGADPGIAPVLPALHPAGATPDRPVPAAWPLAMRVLLQRGETELAPPVYLGAHAGTPRGLPADTPPWLLTLNTDPRLRAAAGIGAQVVREEQEALMSAAWAQAAALGRANAELSRGSTARAVGDNLHRRHLAPTDPVGFARRLDAGGAGADDEADVVLQRTAPVLDRLPAATGTVAGELATQGAAAGAVTAAATRALRPTTVVARRAGATPAAPLVAPVSRLARAELPLFVPPAGDIAYPTFDWVNFRNFPRLSGDAVAGAWLWWRAWARPEARRPLVTPGRHGLMADVVTAEPNPRVPGGLLITVDRDLAPDGTCRVPGPSAFEVPPPDGFPAGAVLAAGALIRGRDSEPALALLYRRDEYVDGTYPQYRTHHLVRWITKLTPAGYGAASGLTEIGAARWQNTHPYWYDGSLSLSARRVASGPDELVVFVADERGVTGIASRPDGTITRGFSYFDERYHGRLAATTVAWVPPASREEQSEPTDVVVAWLREATDGWGGPVWELRYTGIRSFFGSPRPGQAVTAATIGPRLEGEENFPSLDLVVTEVGGGLDAQLLAHVTYPCTSPHDGGVQWRTVQVREVVSDTAFEPLPPPDVEPWPEVARPGDPAPPPPGPFPGPPPEALPVEQLPEPRPVPENLPAPAVIGLPAAGPRTRRIVGDVDETRRARVAAFADRFVVAAEAHQRRTVTEVTATPGDVWHEADYEVSSLAGEVSAALSPGATITRRVLDRIVLDGATLPEAPRGLTADGAEPDPLRPRFYEPVFTQPMSGPLLERFAELVAPGADALPPDGLALMTGNAELVAAYLAGVNTEFGRELVWRGYPSTGRATWFRRFFDTRGTTAGDDGDVLPIDRWGDRELREVATGAASGDGVTLLVRAELLRRFPNTVVQAVPAVRTAAGREPGGPAVNPTATGVLGDDLAVFTFPLDPADLSGHPDQGAAGWFFVFAEPPTQPRFGPQGAAPDWSRPGGPTAGGLLRLPHRVAIHASDLLDGAIA
ncbi:hypothetical protein CKY47_33625 [Saccharothrix yanglingensis]|uniref:Uncharacterized protein n=1 Tax=Saccharothrix yanglingensis TaxID=659496 RepID=A0ABU0XA19_9PSEU|nr:hypothetical protein [Saccharothrix yanglingensis]